MGRRYWRLFPVKSELAPVQASTPSAQLRRNGENRAGQCASDDCAAQAFAHRAPRQERLIRRLSRNGHDTGEHDRQPSLERGVGIGVEYRRGRLGEQGELLRIDHLRRIRVVGVVHAGDGPAARSRCRWCSAATSPPLRRPLAGNSPPRIARSAPTRWPAARRG